MAGAIVIPFSDSVPWLLPGSAIALVVGVAASGPVGRSLGITRIVAAVIIVNLGVILAATLTPCPCLPQPGAGGACDLSRTGLASPLQLVTSFDTAGNMLAFIPLGFAIALIPRSRRKGGLLAGAVALPFAIEAIQLLATPLGRACQSADVVDNLTGLVLGLVAGTLAARIASTRRAATA